ncbi:hypothetical protein LVD17_28260 [Fulvivirga ulvae]|uniref:hypothetical protein n=1 Tax=Fulvivirga ulvae TaxID=2904245 RepID=UPI001F2EF523|nr:hypothetical protein [Fulvivirga ulvae]UII32183.1 hypothetical protein LVD17_28260 [Fulvivirga ulvae]
MTVMEPRIYGDYDDFYRDDVLYDHFLKKFRKKIKKRGLFKSIVRLGAPSLMLKKKLLKKKRSQQKEEKSQSKTKGKIVKLGIKSATSASKAGPAMELVRPTPPRNREMQATMLAPEAKLDSQPEQEDSQPAGKKTNQYILIGAAVGAIALVVMVKRKRNMQ